MGNIQAFNEFLRTQAMYLPLGNFVINLLLTAVLSFLLSKVYIKFGDSLSNRKAFARNFMMISMTTMLIISIVKSSLALSLGLVGALSIVRFRAAIKEPEELAFLFLSISIGLGFGADQTSITIVSFLIISLAIVLQRLRSNQTADNLHLIISYSYPNRIKFEEIVKTLQEYCSKVYLKRFDENKNFLEASFTVEFKKFSDMLALKSVLKKKSGLIKITFLDTKGLM